MRVLIESKSAAESHMGGSNKVLTFVINIQVFTPLNKNEKRLPVYPVQVDKADFDKYEVGKYYDIT